MEKMKSVDKSLWQHGGFGSFHALSSSSGITNANESVIKMTNTSFFPLSLSKSGKISESSSYNTGLIVMTLIFLIEVHVYWCWAFLSGEMLHFEKLDLSIKASGLSIVSEACAMTRTAGQCDRIARRAVVRRDQLYNKQRTLLGSLNDMM